MEKKDTHGDYQLIIKVPYKALDDVQARQIAREYLNSAPLPTGATTKLQRLQNRKEPVGVTL